MITDTSTMDDAEMDNFGVTDSWTRDGGVIVGTVTRQQYMDRRDRAASTHMVRPGVDKPKPRPDNGNQNMNFDA